MSAFATPYPKRGQHSFRNLALGAVIQAFIPVSFMATIMQYKIPRMADRQQNRAFRHGQSCAQGFTKGYTLLQECTANNGLDWPSNAMNIGFGGKGTSKRATTYQTTLVKAWQN